jgi:hypothetical protein
MSFLYFCNLRNRGLPQALNFEVFLHGNIHTCMVFYIKKEYVLYWRPEPSLKDLREQEHLEAGS